MKYEPNFFIVGAPKCGTTALFEYLSNHPHVFASEPKEPHYYATDLPKYRTINTPEGYETLFAGATAEHFAIGEASVFYMYSREALGHIKANHPQAKLIAMLRNPVEMVHSMHSQLIYSRDEDELDFAKAWALNIKRKQGVAIPKLSRDAKVLHYDEIAKLGEQVERLLATFPQEQVMLIFFDDFKKDTPGVYSNVLEFLGLPYFENELQPVNQNKKQRMQWLANFTERPPEVLVKPYLQAKKVLGLDGKKIGLRDPLINANVVETKRETLSLEMRQTIIDTYREDILKLATITGRNLDHWLEP